MSCTCKDLSGQPSESCLGLCGSPEEFVNDLQKNQHRDPLNGLAELILSQVDKMFEARITKEICNIKIEFQEKQNEVWRQAFIEGLRVGLHVGRQIGNSDYD